MKKIYLYISIIFVLNLSIVLFLTLQAKWHNLDSLTNTTQLLDVHFLNNSVGYAVGGDPNPNVNPVILKTTDGINFLPQNINFANKVFEVYPFRQIISSVYPIDENIAYICGNFGLVAKTIDGGENWKVQDFPNEDHLMSMHFFNKNVGFLTGGGGTIAKTNDGGINWDLLESRTTDRLRKIVFVNLDTGFVSGHSGRILRTTDGGNSWHNLQTLKANKIGVYDIDFPSSKIGYAVTNEGQIIKTTNGGDNWVLQKTVKERLRGVAFTTNFSGSVCGDDGLILNTNDGGITWTEQKNPSSDAKHDICFVKNPEKGFTEAYSVGFHGSIMKYKKPLQIEDSNLLAALMENFNPSLLKFSFVLNPSFMFR